MRGTYAIRRRVRYELGVMVLLAAAAGALAFFQPSRPAAAAGPAETGTLLEWKPGQYVQVFYGEGPSNALDTAGLADPWTKTGRDLAAWAEMAWDGQWGYVWGTFGQVLDEQLLAYKLDQFGQAVGEYESVIRARWMDRRTVDCAGLIKSYGWFDPDQGDIVYDSGTMPDIGTDSFFEDAPEKGTIDTLPERPGLLLYAPGHVGVYVGGGWAVEAISHAGGVVKTRVADRPWTHWLACPYIQY